MQPTRVCGALVTAYLQVWLWPILVNYYNHSSIIFNICQKIFWIGLVLITTNAMIIIIYQSLLILARTRSGGRNAWFCAGIQDFTSRFGFIQQIHSCSIPAVCSKSLAVFFSTWQAPILSSWQLCPLQVTCFLAPSGALITIPTY